jgi:hypothetical protein
LRFTEHAPCLPFRELLTHRMRRALWHSPWRALPWLPASGTSPFDRCHADRPWFPCLGLGTSEELPSTTACPCLLASWIGPAGAVPSADSAPLLVQPEGYRFGDASYPVTRFEVTTALVDDRPSLGWDAACMGGPNSPRRARVRRS